MTANLNRTVKRGDQVALAYACFDVDGNELENSGGEFETVVGQGDLLPALEKAVVGMTAGETREVTLPPDKAFGLRDEEAVEYVPLKLLPKDIAEGEMVELLPEDSDEPMQGTVMEIDGDEALVDLNHPYAGQTLVFKITLAEIL